MKPITWGEQFIMAYGGLRGAVGYLLKHHQKEITC
jgi:hypothetical protein